MKVGDLVRHKYDGGVGIIIERHGAWSNITMGHIVQPLVRWIEPPRDNYVNESLYYQVYLELIDSSDKK